jgi:hypothetical protein
MPRTDILKSINSHRVEKMENINKKNNSILEEKMENTKKISIDFGTIAWGALFLLWGITEMFPALPEGTSAVGIGIILLGLNLFRFWKKQPTSRFTITLGVLALLLGALQLARPLLHLSFDLPVFAILLMVLGVIVLGSALGFGKKQ